MPTNNSNTLSREAYLKTFGHPRKKELAIMLLDGASVEDLNAAGFGRINILEAARDIRLKVEGQEGFSIDIPRGTGMDSSSTKDVEASVAATSDEKKDSPAGSSAETPTDTAHAAGQPAGSDSIIPNENATMNENDEKRDENPGDDPGSTEGQGHTTAPDGSEVPGVTADQSNVETLGGNPAGTLTGEEDAETLQQKADEEKPNDAGDAA